MTRLAAAGFRLIRRDLTLALRQRNELVNPLWFFILVVILFPLALGPDAPLLKTMAPGIIWVAAVLAALLSLDRVFRSDFEDGSLEQLLLSHHSTTVLVGAKVLVHWLISGLLILIASPALGVAFGLTGTEIGMLFVTLALGTPVLSLVGAIGAALTVGLRRGSTLLSLLVIPLYVPVLIFAVGAVDHATHNLPSGAQLSMLAALLILSITLTPPATAAALRISA